MFLVYVGSVIWLATGKMVDLSQDTFSFIPALISITVGIFLFVLGVLGIIACISEKRCILSCFFSFLLIILLGEITAAILGIIYRRQLSTVLRSELQREVRLYGNANETALTSQLDYTQQSFKCCGSTNYTDWFTSPWASMHPNRSVSVPDSCCPNYNCSQPLASNSSKSGFLKK